MSAFRFCIVLFSCGTVALGAAEVRLSFAEVGPAAVARDRELAAARWRVEEAEGRLDGSGRLSNPEFGLEYKNGTERHERSLAVSLDQKFPVTSRLRLEREVSSKQVELAWWEVRAASLAVATEARGLAARLIMLDRQRALLRRQINLAAQLASFVNGRAQAGEISALDATQARVDSQRLVLELRKLEGEAVSQRDQLQARLGLGAADTLVLDDALPPLEIPPALSAETRPELRLARVAESVAQSEVALARSREWEDVSVGVVLEGERAEDAPDGLNNSGFIGLRVSVPLPLWNRNQGEVRERTAAARRARLESEAVAFSLGRASDTARVEMENSLRLVEEIRTQLLPLLGEQTGQLEQAYAAGQVDLLAVLRAREQHLQMEAGLLDAERDFHLARIRHQAAAILP